MAATVATPLERALGAHRRRHGDHLHPRSGSSRVTLQFDLDRDIDGAARDVQAAINAARGQLPAGCPATRPTARSIRPTRRS
jgi:multidrug efflux pump